MGFKENVYKIVRAIPEGYLMSYGQVAALAGNRRAPRAAGYAMFWCPYDDVPCHRVLYRDGTLSPGWAFGGKQRERLEAEGVTFLEDGRADIGKHRWHPDAAQWEGETQDDQ